MTARRAPEIKLDVLDSLKLFSDSSLGSFGFKRPAKGFCYTRKVGVAEHKIYVWVNYHPKFDRGAEVQFKPDMCLQMDAVSQVALELVRGNELLLGECPEIITKQPIDFVAPKEMFVRWFATGTAEMAECIQQISDFAKCWVIPLLDRLTSPEDLIRIYTENDSRVTKPHHWYIYIAAAYLVIGQPHKAMEVLEVKLGSTGLRKDYAVVFDSVRKAI